MFIASGLAVLILIFVTGGIAMMPRIMLLATILRVKVAYMFHPSTYRNKGLRPFQGLYLQTLFRSRLVALKHL